MINRSDLTFAALKIPLDYLTLFFAGIASYFIRYERSVQDIRPIVFDLSFEKYLTVISVTAACWIILFAFAGLYNFKRERFINDFTKIIVACSAGMSATIIYMFFVRELFSSRFIILFAWILSILLITVERAILRKLQNFLYRKNFGARRIVIVGADSNTELLIATFKKQKNWGFRVISHIKDVTLETITELKNLLEKRGNIDEIIQADSTLSRAKSIELINLANEYNAIFKFAAGNFESRATNIGVEIVAGVPVVEIRKTKLDGWGRIAKRFVDLIISTILMIILSPILLVIAILIKLENWGPAIYKNERVGQKGNFNVYKFRSMYTKYCTGKQFAKYADQQAVLEYEKELVKNQSERKGPVYKVLNDPRRTRIGRFLERTSLDELPQFFNVWIGNMSIVGPRPHQPREVEKYEKAHKRVLDIKPGVTGMAQISGRSDLNFDDEVKLDTYYIENWSLKLDFWIMLKTPWVILTRKSKI
ncbi:sugar transferase [Candidatus Falkowbacteria bacterium]|nr:sugar transferase [Candidatus Falkowbacteria bacterium]